VLALLRVLFIPRRRPVDVPAGVPMAEHLPAYLKQEFHAIPNGNYSNRLVGPYVEGFDASMLGRMHGVRDWIARRFLDSHSVLEVGCGGGKLASAIQRAGVPDVWGIDASPYMLRYGAQLNPDVKFVQGLAERLPFTEGRFDAAAICFMFHELPALSADRAISEIRRVLKPGGKLIIVEPGPEQLSTVNPFKLWKLAGLAGVYFGILARFVFEPFVKEWHARDHGRWLENHGFKVLEERSPFPLRVHVAERLPTAL
jgi:ubiquinone/menaquinone biosynthesis C-methylase UbiE